MKKILCVWAVCMMAVMIGCKNKGKTEAATAKDSVTAVIDSIIEENDTTPMPMFLMGSDQYAHMLYWSYLEEPQKTEDNGDYFEAEHQRWTLQEMFRRNKTAYTNMLMDGKFVKIKFVDEVLKDPDGNTPSIGECHRPEIPSLCARFDYADPKEKKPSEYGAYQWGSVIVTDGYLQSRKHLPVVYDESEWDKPKPLPKTVVAQLKKKYGMEVERTCLLATIGDSCLWGILQFKGQYKNAPKDGFYGSDPVALALDVLIVGDKVYVNEELGRYDEQYGPGWNADDGGEYVGCLPLAAFEGPKGLEICFERDAPESSAVGMFYVRGGQLVQVLYETYHNLIDEEIPVWKKDIAEMCRLFLEDNPHDHKDIRLTKWAYTYVNYDDEWIMMRDSLEQHGALFVRKDGKISLVGVETERLKFSRAEKDGVSYLKLSGPAGGPSYYTYVWAYKNGKKIEEFSVLQIYGEVSEGTINGSEASPDVLKKRFESLPSGEALIAYFRDVENKNN